MKKYVVVKATERLAQLARVLRTGWENQIKLAQSRANRYGRLGYDFKLVLETYNHEALAERINDRPLFASAGDLETGWLSEAAVGRDVDRM